MALLDVHDEVGTGRVAEEAILGVCGGWPSPPRTGTWIRAVAFAVDVVHGVLVRDVLRSVAERSHGRHPDPGRRCTKARLR